MSRAARIEFPGALYLSHGARDRGMKVFDEDGDFQKFLGLVGEKAEAGDVLGMVSPAKIEGVVKAEFGDPRIKGKARSILATISRFDYSILGFLAMT